MTLAELVEQYLEVHQAAPATIEKLRWLLAKATAAFGDSRLADLHAEEICAWRGTLPDGHRFEARQVLNAAVAWQLIDVNPAKRGVPNPLRRFQEKRPFESWDEITAVSEGLGPVAGPMVLFGAATGLRPAELVALERRDLLQVAGVVYVRRQFVRGQIKAPKDAAESASGAAPVSRARGARAVADVGESTPSFQRRAAAISTCTTSALVSGGRRRSRSGSTPFVGRTTCGTPMPRSRFVLASRRSMSPASWARAWR